MPVLVTALVLVVVAAAVAGVILLRHKSKQASAIATASPTATTAPVTSSPPASPTSSPTPAPTPTPTQDFATLYAREQSGVVRIETVSCSDSGVGTGFLLSPTLVATVDHVIADSAVVSLIDGSQRTTGTVIGSDPAHDLALVRASRPLVGYHFQFASAAPVVGEDVAAIGFPIGEPITLTQGTVSGLNRRIAVDNSVRNGLIETDAAINFGNSGGPLVTVDGAVIGLVDAIETDASGIAYAVPATQAGTAMRGWQQAPSGQAPASCDNPLGPSQEQADVPTPSGGSVTEAQGIGIVAAFQTYFNSINDGDYATAYTVLSPRHQSAAGEAAFAAGDATSFDIDLALLGSKELSARSVEVDLAFTSLQAAAQGPDGDTCDDWTLAYTMIQATDGTWLIDAARPYGATNHTTCS